MNEFERRIEPEDGSESRDGGAKEGATGRGVKVVSDFQFRSPAERGLIPDYVLTQMKHRPDGLAQGQTPGAGGTATVDSDAGKIGRKQHDVRATSERPFGPTPQRVSDLIVRRYRWAVDALWRRVVAEDEGVARHRPVGPLEIVDLLLRRVPELSNSTWNTNRAAVLYWLDGMPDDPDALQARMILLTGCPKDGFKGPKPGTTTTRYSSKTQRKRTFARRDYDRLLKYLDRRAAASSRSLSPGALVGSWLRAGFASGLRPVEWVEATWADQSKEQLRVKTAKRRRQKADWTAGLARLERDSEVQGTEDTEPVEEYRLVAIDEKDRSAVDDFMTKFQSLLRDGEDYPTIYRRVRQYLWESSLAVFGEDGQKFRLYQMRGQFAANRKARQGVSATADEMGNAPSKASTYYGNAIYAHRTARGAGDKPADRQSVSESEQSGIHGNESEGG